MQSYLDGQNNKSSLIAKLITLKSYVFCSSLVLT